MFIFILLSHSKNVVGITILKSINDLNNYFFNLIKYTDKNKNK